MKMNGKLRLAERVRTRTLTIAPGVYDMISARIADELGFDAIYMTGYGVTASHLGLPDAGLASYTEMKSRAQMIATGTSTPLIADADTGYGGLLNVQRTVRGYEAAGVAAIQLEDQEFPKKCGHTEGRRVISLEDMVRKIEVAVASREDPNFLIIARTDSRTSLGLDEALRRADAYRAAGADILFVESPEDEAEFERIGKSIDAPLLANMVESGRSPLLNAERLAELGFTIALYPGTAFMAAAHTLSKVYSHLRVHGTSLDLEQPLNTLSQMNKTMGFDSVWEFEKKWSGT